MHSWGSWAPKRCIGNEYCFAFTRNWKQNANNWLVSLVCSVIILLDFIFQVGLGPTTFNYFSDSRINSVTKLNNVSFSKKRLCFFLNSTWSAFDVKLKTSVLRTCYVIGGLARLTFEAQDPTDI